MRLDDLTLEVRDRTLKRVGQVTGRHLSFKGKKRWCGVGEWELTLPGDHAMVPHLMEKGSGIVLTGPVGSTFHPRTWTAWNEERRNIVADPLGANAALWSVAAGVLSAVEGGRRHTTNSTSAKRLTVRITQADYAPNTTYRVRARVTISKALTLSVILRPTATSATAQTIRSLGALPAGTHEIDVEMTTTATAGSSSTAVGLTWSDASATDTTVDLMRVSVQRATETQGDLLVGDTLNSLLERVVWSGVAGSSSSVYQTRAAATEPYTTTAFGTILSGPTITPTRVRNRQNPDGTYTFKGVTDEVLLQGALAFPSPEVGDPAAQTRANDTRTGSTESLLRQFVAYNVANGAVRPAGAITWAPEARLRGLRRYLVLEGESADRGISQQKSPRFQPLLELLQEMIAGDPDYGFEVVQVGNLLHFRVLEAADRTRTVRLDVENGTITSEEVAQQGPTLTDAIVGGQGEGTKRTIIQRTTEEAVAAEDEWGIVWERFIDQRDTNDLVELGQSAAEALQEESGGTAVKMLPSDDATMQYGLQWVVGDLLTAVVLGAETVARSTEAVFVADSSGVMVGTAIGDVSGFTQQDAQGAKVASLDERVTRLERLETATPSGVVQQFAGTSAPRGYLLCDGSTYDPVKYPGLYRAIGTIYGGTASAPLLPDLRGRVPVGGQSGDSQFGTLGQKGGAKTHTLTYDQVPPQEGVRILWGQSGNVHFDNVQAIGGPSSGNGIYTWQNDPKYQGGIPGAVGGQAHNNLQPYIVVNFIIKT